MGKIFDKFFKRNNNNSNEQHNGTSDNVVHYCCMCGAPETDVNLIIRGQGGNYICDRCSSMIHYQMTELYKYADDLKNEETKHEIENIVVPTPKEIKEYLDSYVVGQDDAKIKLAVAVYNHYKRICQPPTEDVDIEKANCIMIGHSGSGKTLLVKTIAKLLDIPTVVVDSTVYTQAGYVGEDVESILSRLVQAADGNIKKAERGIVFIDEIDKIARKGDNPSITKDVSGEGVQQALLKLMEDSKVRIAPGGGRKHPEKELLEIDTKNILFICSGAFVGIERQIGRRMKMNAVGFANEKERQKVDNTNLLKYITTEDIRSYGIIPELVGRLPIITYVNELDKDALKRILVEPKNAIIKQYVKLFEMDGVKLVFNDDTLDYIVDKAVTMKLGARSLRSIVEEIMTQYMFDVPTSRKKKLVVTKEYAQSILEPTLAETV